MSKIFISYRREDSAYPAQSIYDRLAANFGNDSVVFDVDTIPLGIDFRRYLTDAVEACDVLLAVIGDRWLEVRDSKGKRRLDNTNDFVRIEIQAALRREIPVIPVLVGKAAVPAKEDLPHGLKSLSYRNAADLRPGRDFHSHLDLLVRGVERLLESLESVEDDDVVPRTPPAPETPPAQPETRPPQPTPPVASTSSGESVTSSLGMELVLVSAGEFLMGSSDDDAPERETPQHRVRISQPFYLGKYPVTQKQYEEVCGTNPSQFGGNDNRPVESVAWFDAVNFCNKLSENEGFSPCYSIDGEQVAAIAGMGYRLPSEAEWEYACRAGTETKWTFGNDSSELERYAWYSGNASETQDVGQKEANPWGFHDVYGNVWEWCWDWYAGGYYAESPTKDPQGPDSGSSRVLRGGSFFNDALNVRSASRSSNYPDDRTYDVGFRLARTYH